MGPRRGDKARALLLQGEGRAAARVQAPGRAPPRRPRLSHWKELALGWHTWGHRRMTLHPHAPGGRAAGLPGPPLALLVALAVAAALGACGLKTPPQPLSEVLPATSGVQAWQREGDVIIAWNPPSPSSKARYGGLRGYALWVQARPLLCPDCPPESPRRVHLQAGDPALHAEAGRVFYRWPLGPQAGQLSLRVSTRYGIGQGPASPVVRVMRAGAIPVPALHWRWVGGQAGGARAVQFYWPAVQERIVQVIGSDAVPREQVLDYRANLYRRVPPAAYPLLPLNPRPLTTAHFIVPPLQSGPASATGAEAYELRFVDQFGNEGPPSPEAQVPLAGQRP